MCAAARDARSREGGGGTLDAWRLALAVVVASVAVVSLPLRVITMLSVLL